MASRENKRPARHSSSFSKFYCGVGFPGGDATRAGVPFIAGDVLAAGDDLGDGDGLAEADGFGDGDCIADPAGFLIGTDAEATSCHCPLRRSNVSTDRNWPLVF